MFLGLSLLAVVQKQFFGQYTQMMVKEGCMKIPLLHTSPEEYSFYWARWPWSSISSVSWTWHSSLTAQWSDVKMSQDIFPSLQPVWVLWQDVLDCSQTKGDISMSALPLVSVTVPLVDALNLGMTTWEIKQGTILFAPMYQWDSKSSWRRQEVHFLNVSCWPF